MPAIDLVGEFLKTVKIKGSATVLHKPGAVRLDGYPRLVYAPREHGPGVRTEDNGTPVVEIATAFAEASGNARAVADRFGTSLAHVADAVRYATETGYLGK